MYFPIAFNSFKKKKLKKFEFHKLKNKIFFL